MQIPVLLVLALFGFSPAPGSKTIVVARQAEVPRQVEIIRGPQALQTQQIATIATHSAEIARLVSHPAPVEIRRKRLQKSIDYRISDYQMYFFIPNPR